MLVLIAKNLKTTTEMIQIPKAVPIKKVIVETPHVKTFVFEYKLGAKPGQFANLWIPRVDEKPMSIAYDNGKEFWVTIFAVGNFSTKMHTLKAGDMVGVRGPYGKGFSFTKGQRLVMMAGGYGAAPLYFLTTEAIKQGCKVDFVIGARGKEHLLYIDRIKKLKNVKLHVATDDGSVGVKGYNTTILEKLVKDGKKIGNVYGCGPELMLKRISDICFAAKVSAQLSIERYMKCGFGVCGQCSVDPKGQRMCMEGPVVSNEQARKITEFGKFHRDSVGKMHNF
jgi:dihydroorotate dehydrogenase electron transfer subunit